MTSIEHEFCSNGHSGIAHGAIKSARNLVKYFKPQPDRSDQQIGKSHPARTTDGDELEHMIRELDRRGSRFNFLP